VSITKPTPRLLLVRHGQSTWNANGRWQGQADPPLSDLGIRQAEAARDAVAQLAFDLIVASDLERARRTAELLAPTNTEIVIEAGLRERHAGDWTGLTHDEIAENYPGWIEDGRRPPGFENDAELLARVLPVLESLAGTVDATLIVTHGGVVRSIERSLGGPPEKVPNLGGRWIQFVDSEFVLGEGVLLFDRDQIEFTAPEQI